MSNCENCAEKNVSVSVPYVVHEAEMARNERQIKRMWVAVLCVVFMLFASNIAWLYAWCQYDYSSSETTEEIVVDAADGGTANYIGQDGAIYNGKSDGSENEHY